MPQLVMTSRPAIVLQLLLVLSCVAAASARPVELAGEFTTEQESAALILDDRQWPPPMSTPDIAVRNSGA